MMKTFKPANCHVELNLFRHVSLLKEKLDPGVKKEVDGMGVPDIKYGDSVCYIQHVDTYLWLTYQTIDAKCARMGGVQRKVSHCIKQYCISKNFSHLSLLPCNYNLCLFSVLLRGWEAERKRQKWQQIKMLIPDRMTLLNEIVLKMHASLLAINSLL